MAVLTNGELAMAKPTRFAVDPEFDLFRRLAIAESPAALGELFGDDAALFVLPVDAQESVREGYRDLAERLGAKAPILDESLSTLPEGRSVWLLGWENRHRATFARTVADQDVEFRPGRLRIGQDMRERDRECIVLVGREPISVDYAPGTVQVVEQHDGSRLALRKLDADYDPHDRLGAQTFLQKHAAKGQIVTGLLYVDPDAEDLHTHLDTVETPLNTMDEQALCPGSSVLDKINASLR